MMKQHTFLHVSLQAAKRWSMSRGQIDGYYHLKAADELKYMDEMTGNKERSTAA